MQLPSRGGHPDKHRKATPMTLCLVLLLAATLAAIVGGPLALLVPMILPAMVDVPYVDTYQAPTESAVHFAETTAGKCQPAVRVYASRSGRPTQVACAARPSPAGAPLDKHGRPLQSAARKARLARAEATYCRGGK